MRFLLVVASLFTLPSPAPAQPAEAARHWVVDWGEKRCSLASRTEGADSVSLVVRTSLGNNRNGELALVDPRWSRNPLPPNRESRVAAVLHPGGERIEGYGSVDRLPGGERVLLVRDLGSIFLDSLAEAERLSLEAGDRTLAAVPLLGAGEAVAALEACNDDLFASWGIDLEFQRSLQSNPVPIGTIRGWFWPSPYPYSALIRRQSGSVVVRYTVGTDGRARDCAPVASSGVEALDVTTCRVFERIGRFRPALGPDGEPVDVPQISTVHWRLAD